MSGSSGGSLRTLLHGREDEQQAHDGDEHDQPADDQHRVHAQHRHPSRVPPAVTGARGGIRTHTPLRATDFESAVSTVPPLGPGPAGYWRARPVESVSMTTHDPAAAARRRERAAQAPPRPSSPSPRSRSRSSRTRPRSSASARSCPRRRSPTSRRATPAATPTRMARHRDALAAPIAELEREQDALLDRMAAELSAR